MLYNTNLYNTGPYGSNTGILPVYPTDPAVFENFSLSDGTHMLLEGLGYSGPTTDIQGGSVPRLNGKYVTAVYRRENTIVLTGYVKAATGAALDAYLDTIRAAVRKPQGNLDLTDSNGTAKRFVATVDNYDQMFAARKGYHVTFCPFTIQFRCDTPFGKARSYTSSSVYLTASPVSLQLYQAGTVAADPIVTLIFDSASSVTVADIQRLDASGNVLEEIQYAGSVAMNDVLIFNSELKTVTKNTAAVLFAGSFLTADAGSNLYKFTVTGTSFAATATVAFRNTYL